MNIAWVTDPHLNFLNTQERFDFYKTITENPEKIDAVMISGDIGEATDTVKLLTEMSEFCENIPIYFVLGNHDYYCGSVAGVREKIDGLVELFWMNAEGPLELSNTTILVGIDGFADARNGNWKTTPVMLNDSRYIRELADARVLAGVENYYTNKEVKYPIYEAMRKLADEDAKLLDAHLQMAIELKPETIMVLTHVPPFPEVALYRGKPSDPDFLPFYTSKATGDVLLAHANKCHGINFKVYCGHTHGKAHATILPNLEVFVGESEYGSPKVQKIISV